MSKPFELGDEAAGLTFGVTALVVVAAQVTVDFSGGEHVPVGDEHRVLDGAQGAAVADAGAQPSVEGLQVAAVGTGGRERGFFQGDAQPLGALAAAPRAALARRLVVARAASGPGGQVSGRREAAHVGAD